MNYAKIHMIYAFLRDDISIDRFLQRYEGSLSNKFIARIDFHTYNGISSHKAYCIGNGHINAVNAIIACFEI